MTKLLYNQTIPIASNITRNFHLVSSILRAQIKLEVEIIVPSLRWNLILSALLWHILLMIALLARGESLQLSHSTLVRRSFFLFYSHENNAVFVLCQRRLKSTWIYKYYMKSVGDIIQLNSLFQKVQISYSYPKLDCRIVVWSLNRLMK